MRKSCLGCSACDGDLRLYLRTEVCIEVCSGLIPIVLPGKVSLDHILYILPTN
jgi:hypothetical protein